MTKYADRCYKIDDQIRKKHGWTSMAFVGVNFAKPKNKLEKKATKFVEERYRHKDGSGGTYAVHIYDIVDLVIELMGEKE
jgi:hypothetical protein